MTSARNLLLSSVRVVLLGLFLTLPFAAQDDEDVQSWNDIQLAVHLNQSLDLVLSTTYRFGGNISRLNEARAGAGLAVKINRSLSAAGGYTYIESRSKSGPFAHEHRYHIGATYKFPVEGFGLSHRSQFEYRVRGSGKSWRYRPSLTFEKALPESFLSKSRFFVTEEPFYVSTTGKFSRNRLSVGIKKTVSKHLSLDLYYLRQNDGYSHPGDLNVIGTAWKFTL